MHEHDAASRSPDPNLGTVALALVEQAPPDAAAILAPLPDADVAGVLHSLNPSVAQDILDEFDESRRAAIIAAAPAEEGRQWTRNRAYPEGSVGRLMEPSLAVFRPDMSVAETVEGVREIAKQALVTYGFVTDAEIGRAHV